MVLTKGRIHEGVTTLYDNMVNTYWCNLDQSVFINNLSKIADCYEYLLFTNIIHILLFSLLFQVRDTHYLPLTTQLLTNYQRMK